MQNAEEHCTLTKYMSNAKSKNLKWIINQKSVQLYSLNQIGEQTSVQSSIKPTNLHRFDVSIVLNARSLF